MEKIQILSNKTKFITLLSIFIIFIVLLIITTILILNKYNKKTQDTFSETSLSFKENSEDSNIQTDESNNEVLNTEIDGNNNEFLNIDIDENNNEQIKKWNLILVNKDNYLPDDFEVELKTLTNGHQVDERIFPYLQKMLDDAREEGLKPVICSTYRSKKNQTKLYNNKVDEYKEQGYSEDEAKKEASMWVAIPGTSEHHTGLAVDIVCSIYQTLDEKQEETEVQKWLLENSYKYGFILRYPTNKSQITGINYEPWHYRYVGIEHAKKIKEQNITLEEYIEQLVL